jgi:predicted acylesterase/phospholipase RssA
VGCVSVFFLCWLRQGGPQRLLLNHLTTPHVLLRSAVAASCSLPGIMKPNILLSKDQEGRVNPFELDGVQYVDGSLQGQAACFQAWEWRADAV